MRKLSFLLAATVALVAADLAQARGIGFGFGLRRPRQVNVQNNFFGGGVPAQAAFFPQRSFGYGQLFAFQRSFAPSYGYSFQRSFALGYGVQAAPAFYYQPAAAAFAPAYSGCGAALAFGYGAQAAPPVYSYAAPAFVPACAAGAPSCAGAAFQLRY